MPYEFRLPDIGEGVAEGEVVQWFVEEGATVREDAPLVSVLTDKANVEIPSPKTGKVIKLHAKVGEIVKVGAVLVTLDATGAPAGSASSSPAPPNPPRAPNARTAPVASPAAAAPGVRILASPNVRRLAAEAGIDLSKVTGTGPAGRITEADLGRPSGGAGNQTTASGTTVSSPSASSRAAPAPAADDVERVPIRGVRRVISEHMAQSVHTAAHYTYVEEVDASELVRVRDGMAKHVEKDGVRLSYLPFVVRAVVAGLRRSPWMNARMDDAKQELEVHHRFHIGIATAAPDGLLVPVLRDAQTKSISRLASEIQELSSRARAGKLERSEMTGGTFTITSLGALGGVLATPILNYPEVGIMGVHRIVKRPVFLADGSVGAAHLMNLSISLDHRVLDGIVGAQFLSVVKAHLEDPHQLFADLA